MCVFITLTPCVPRYDWADHLPLEYVSILNTSTFAGRLHVLRHQAHVVLAPQQDCEGGQGAVRRTGVPLHQQVSHLLLILHAAIMFVPLLRGHCQSVTILVLELLDKKGLCSIWSPVVLQCG